LLDLTFDSNNINKSNMRHALISLLPTALLASIASAANFTVTVGQGAQLKFVPDQLNAAVGDTITYQFFSKVCLPQART
jgi:plastocyanin